MVTPESPVMKIKGGFYTACGAMIVALGVHAWSIWNDTQTDRATAKEFIAAQVETNKIQANRNVEQDKTNTIQISLNFEQSQANKDFREYMRTHKP